MDEEYRKKLEEKLPKVWKEVRESFNYPQIPKPVFDEKTQEIEMKNHRIVINPEYVKELEGKGLSQDDALKAMLSHYLGHYFYKNDPWDFTNMLFVENEMSLVDEKRAAEFRNAYNDVCVDLKLLLRHRKSGAEKLLSRTGTTSIDRLLRAYYQDQSGYDMGLGGTNALEEKYVKRIKTIDFFDRSRLKYNSRRFGKILKDYINELPKGQGSGGGDGKESDDNEQDSGGKMQDPKGKKDANSIGDEDGKDGYSGCCGTGKHMDHEAFGEDEVREGIRELAKGMDPEEFKKAAKRLGIGKVEGKGIGISGVGSPEITSKDYYQTLSEAYRIGILEKPNIKSDTMYPETHKKYEMGDPFNEIDFLNSYGKIIPGVTQKWKYSEMDVHGKLEGIPDALLVIDSSSSMVNPSSSLSYAALGGFCASNAYLDSGSKVGVINFSGNNQMLSVDFTDDRDKVYGALASYFAGGTVIPLQELKQMVNKNEKECDIILISDTQIDNLVDTINYLKGIENKNRVTVLCIGDSYGDLQKYSDDKFSIYSIESLESLPDIILGDIRGHLSGKKK